MSPRRSRFVTASQQVLALAVVLVALAPAARVLSLDVVAVHPGHAVRNQADSDVGGHLGTHRSGAVGRPLVGRDLLAPFW